MELDVAVRVVGRAGNPVEVCFGETAYVGVGAAEDAFEGVLVVEGVEFAGAGGAFDALEAER